MKLLMLYILLSVLADYSYDRLRWYNYEGYSNYKTDLCKANILYAFQQKLEKKKLLVYTQSDEGKVFLTRHNKARLD